MSSSIIRLSSICLGLLFVSACGNSGLGTDTDGGNKDLSAASNDLSGVAQDFDVVVSVGPDLASRRSSAASRCGQQTCGATETCCSSYDSTTMSISQMCTTDTTCGDGGIAAACDGPEDCSGSKPNCCVDDHNARAAS